MYGFLFYFFINFVIIRNYFSRDVNVDIMFVMNIFFLFCCELLGVGRYNINKFRFCGIVFSIEFLS